MRAHDLWVRAPFSLPRTVNETTKFQFTTEHREEAPRLAAKTEKRVVKYAKIQISTLFVV